MMFIIFRSSARAFLVGLSLCGTWLVGVGCGPSESVLKVARNQLYALDREIYHFSFEHGRFPTTLQELADGRPDSYAGQLDEGFPDPWGQPYVYLIQTDAEGNEIFCLRSAGPDGVPFNGDDVMLP